MQTALESKDPLLAIVRGRWSKPGTQAVDSEGTLQLTGSFVDGKHDPVAQDRFQSTVNIPSNGRNGDIEFAVMIPSDDTRYLLLQSLQATLSLTSGGQPSTGNYNVTIDLDSVEFAVDHVKTILQQRGETVITMESGRVIRIAESVNADWNAGAGAAQILNKPVIPSVAREALQGNQSKWPLSKLDITVQTEAQYQARNDKATSGLVFTT